MKFTTGMRNVRTIQSVRHRSVPTTRLEMAAQLARLEHEKAGLERALKVFEATDRRIRASLEQAVARIDLLRHRLYDSSDDNDEEGGNGDALRTDETESSTRKPPRVVSVEY